MGDDVRIRFGADNSAVLKSVDRVKASVAGLKGAVSSGLGAVGIGLGGAALIGYLKGVAAEIDNLDRRAIQLRASVEGVQRLEFVARQNKADVDVVSEAMLKLDKALGGLADNETANKALKDLGIAGKELIALDVEERLYRLADAYVASGDKGVAYAAMTKLLGLQAKNLIPILSHGGAALREMGAALEVVAEADVKKIALMNDRFDELSQTVRNKVVSGLLSAAEATEKLGVVLAAVWAVRNEPMNSEAFAAGIDAAAEEFSRIEGFVSGARENAAELTEETLAAEAAAGKYAEELERAKGELEMQQFLAAQQVEILDQQIAAGKELADQKAEAFAMEIAALEAIGDAEEQRTAELKKQSEEAARLRGLLDNAPYSDLRRIGGGHRNEVLGPVSGGGGGVPRVPGGAGDAVSAAGLERVADGVLRLERLNELIEGNTMRTAEAVQRVAAATAYSPEQDLRALLDVGRDVVSAVEEVGDRLAKGLIVEARVG
jgi:PAS domain-containing protein